MQHFRKNIPKHRNMKSFKSELAKVLTNEDCIYGYDGEPIKVKPSEVNFKVSHKKGKNKDQILIELLPTETKEQINKE